MAAYRLYCLDGVGRISLAEWISATDDRDAICQAHDKNLDALKCEIWKGERLVATLEAEELSGLATTSDVQHPGGG
ncbi:MAG TPA: hypothetical protein VHN55_03905 [Sphingomicrobium sp.]|nr:hypothetical protein [Sphingomicrobium sp.]